MQPWLLSCSHAQTLVSTLNPATYTGFSIVLNTLGSLDVVVGSGDQVECVATGLRPQEKTWAKLKLTLHSRVVKVSLTHIPFRVEPIPPPASFEGQLDGRGPVLQHQGPLLIAAGPESSSSSNGTSGCNPRQPVADFFNGRIDSLTLKTLGQHSSTLAKYDFSLDMSSDHIVDISGRGHDGVLVNAPTRAVTGHDWDGSECDWTRAKSGYGAIHFHDDDLDDAAWDTDFTLTIPSTARSGAYAVEVVAADGRDTDHITFFVRPTSWASDNSTKVCLVFSTLTYLAYANERMYDTTRHNTTDIGPGFDMGAALASPELDKMRRRADLGLSLYDRHADGSGVCLSSSRRPILNVRPGYVMWAFSRPREFSADLMMLGFLERAGVPYEILTDHDLHARGAAGALRGFGAVVTGSHPEYPTPAVLAAYAAYARGGGNLLYLGGNGFYWASALLADGDGDGDGGHRLEVRRADAGVRAFTLPGGEHVHALDGRRGGLWRSRGAPPNALFGVGFCAQGTGPGVPYRRTEASRDPRFAWIFDGVNGGDGGSDLIGERGLGGGASGDEIDRHDVANGSPPEGGDVTVLATSTGHGDDFGIAVEDLSFPALQTLGTQTDLIRSDMVYYVGAGGGVVFSVGSINWYCSLAWDDYDNDVARLTLNVIKGLLAGKR